VSTTSYLTNLFGRSPIRPLQQHMTKVHACVLELKPLFAAVIATDMDEVNKVQHRIAALENEADVLKKELRQNLPKGLMMPVDRRDLLEVLLMQDNMANQTKDIAGLIRGRKMTIPGPMQELFVEYADRSIEASEKALAVINELDELVETGFRGREVDRVEKMIEELNRVEHESDEMQVQLRAILFDMEDDLRAMRATDVMFTYQLIEWTGMVADHAQRVGSRLQLLLAK